MNTIGTLRMTGLGLLLTALAAPAAQAQNGQIPLTSGDPRYANTRSQTSEAITEAIEHQRSRRTGAIVGFALGGAAILGGVIGTDIKLNDDDDNYRYYRDENGYVYRERHYKSSDYVPLWIGLGIGLPVIGYSAYVFTDSQRQINRLRLDRLTVGAVPEAGGGQLRLSLSFR